MSYYKNEKDIVDDGSKMIATLIVLVLMALVAFGYAKYGYERLEAVNTRLLEENKTLRCDYDRINTAYLTVTSELEICKTK